MVTPHPWDEVCREMPRSENWGFPRVGTATTPTSGSLPRVALRRHAATLPIESRHCFLPRLRPRRTCRPATSRVRTPFRTCLERVLDEPCLMVDDHRSMRKSRGLDPAPRRRPDDPLKRACSEQIIRSTRRARHQIATQPCSISAIIARPVRLRVDSDVRGMGYDDHMSNRDRGIHPYERTTSQVPCPPQFCGRGV